MIRQLLKKSVLRLFVFVLGALSGGFLFASDLSLTFKTFIVVTNIMFALTCYVLEDHLQNLKEEEMKAKWMKPD